MASVVIAAHQEESVIGRCLDALSRQERVDRLEIVVSANGCTDGTVIAALRPGVRVLDRPQPGKTGALNAADDVASSFPRIYLDADIELAPDAVHRLSEALAASPETLVAVPARRIETCGRPVLVRAYYAINAQLPVFRDGLFGRGTICVSAAGRSRFGRFPAIVADDLFLDSLYSATERVVVPEVEVVVQAPHTTRDLLARLVRVRRGNAELRAVGGEVSAGTSPRTGDNWAWLRSVVLPNPRLAPAAVAYVLITVAASVLARHTSSTAWGRDESTRTAATATTSATR